MTIYIFKNDCGLRVLALRKRGVLLKKRSDGRWTRYGTSVNQKSYRCQLPSSVQIPYRFLLYQIGRNGCFHLYQSRGSRHGKLPTAILQSDQIDILYLWGYILFKQGRYAEARAKYEALLEIDLQRGFRYRYFEDTLSNLEKTYSELGEEAAVPQAFRQLEELLEKALQDRVSARSLEDALSNLGHAYLKLGDKAAARRVFAKLLEHYPDSPHNTEVERLLKKQ